MRLAASGQFIGMIADSLAAGALAAATAFSCLELLGAGWALAGGSAVLLLTFGLLRRIEPWPNVLPLPRFEAIPVGVVEQPDELLLTADMAVAVSPLDSGELLLDDILAEIETDPTVVNLFDPHSMPTAGDLQETIDRHLQASSNPADPPDAAKALSDALAELRHSLR